MGETARRLAKPRSGGRVETGAIQFGADKRGLFMRGDDALYLANILSAAATGHMIKWQKEEARRIHDIIISEVLFPGFGQTTEE